MMLTIFDGDHDKGFLLIVNKNHKPGVLSEFFSECLKYPNKKPENLIQKYFNSSNI
jgi:hypothetical protein